MSETPEQQLDRLRAAARIVAQVHTRDMHEGRFVVDVGASGGVFRNRACIPEDVWLKAWGDIRELTGLDLPQATSN